MRRLIPYLLTPLLAGALALGPAAPATSAKPGPAGPRITLANDVQLAGYDIAYDGGGTAYVGWIAYDASQLRRVQMCALPPGAKACAGGVKTIDSLGPSSAEGLQVVTGPGAGATLVWFHDTDESVTLPDGGRLATASAGPDGSLSPATDRARASSFGSLQTAELSPAGQLWAVTQASSNTPNQLAVYVDFGPPQPVTAPFFVNLARLAFRGTTAVLAVDEFGPITEPIAYSVLVPGSPWTGFRTVANTWNVGGFDLAASRAGIRLVASTADASYQPAVAKFSGTTFGRARLTGDKEACSTSSHDLVTDASGRLADVGNGCSTVRITNLPGTDRAALTDFPAGGTLAGGAPQIVTSPAGTGWVAWGILSAAGVRLQVVPVRLPALRTTSSENTAVGKVTVTGPATCLPPVTTKVQVKASGKNGWRPGDRTLRLGDQAVKGGKIDGADLKAGKSYRLVGTVRFARPGDGFREVEAVHKFRTCPAG